MQHRRQQPVWRIFDMPLGYFGFVYYLYMFGLAALLASDPFSRGLRFYAAIGVLSSICFMYIQFTFIHAFCIYCAISAALTLLLFLAALWHVRTMSVAPHRQLSGGRWPASHRAVHQTR